jgi:hypothetical protein
MHGEILVVDANEEIGQEGRGGCSACDEAVVVGGEGGVAEKREDVGLEICC